MAKHKYATTPPRISTMPPGVPYIVGNEAAERFSYYGMNSILTIFMTKYLLDKMGHLSVMSPTNAEAWYHTFVSARLQLVLFFDQRWVVRFNAFDSVVARPLQSRARRFHRKTPAGDCRFS